MKAFTLFTAEELRNHKPTKEQLARAALPYGKWTCADGREVLFNRGYLPIWERIGGVVKKAREDEWVENIVEEEHFFVDSNAPWRNKKTLATCKEILASWNLPETKSETLQE